MTIKRIFILCMFCRIIWSSFHMKLFKQKVKTLSDRTYIFLDNNAVYIRVDISKDTPHTWARDPSLIKLSWPHSHVCEMSSKVSIRMYAYSHPCGHPTSMWQKHSLSATFTTPFGHKQIGALNNWCTTWTTLASLRSHLKSNKISKHFCFFTSKTFWTNSWIESMTNCKTTAQGREKHFEKKEIKGKVVASHLYQWKYSNNPSKVKEKKFKMLSWLPSILHGFYPFK